MKLFDAIPTCILFYTIFVLLPNCSRASADSLIHLIDQHVAADDTERALYYADYVLQEFQHNNDWKGQRKVYKLIKNLPYSIENEALVNVFYENIIDRLAKDYPRESASVRSYLGEYLANHFLYDKAIPVYEKAATELSQLNDTIDLHFVYFHLGQALVESRSDGVQANVYADAALRVYQKKKRQSPVFKGHLIGLKGWAHRSIDKKLALQYYEQAILATGDRRGIYREQICRILLNLNRFEEVLKKAEALDETKYGNPEKHALLAQAFTGLGRYDEAKAELQIAQDIYTSWQYTNSIDYIKLFYFKAIAQQRKDELLESITSCQKVYELSLSDFKAGDVLSFPAIDQGKLTLWAYNSLLLHGKALRGLFDMEKDVSYLKASIKLFNRLLLEVESRRWDMPNWSSKEAFNKFVYGSYDEALLATTQLFEYEPSEDHQNELLNLYERSKSTLFRESILSKSLSEIALSQEDKIIEDSFQSNIAALFVDRAKLKSKGVDDEEIEELNKNLFNYQEALKHFKEDRFGRRSDDKFKLNTLNTKRLQSALGSKKALLAYHVTQNEIIQLYFTGDKLDVERSALNDELSNSFKTLRRGLSDWNLILDSTNLSFQLINEARSIISTHLFSLIRVPEEVEQMVVVPDRHFHLIPFELLTLNPKRTNRKYAITYLHSLGELLSKDKTSMTSHKYNFGGFAPTYLNNCDQHLSSQASIQDLETDLNLRNSLADLPHARANAKFAAKLMNGHAWIGDMATKTRFLESMNSYRVLHLGMHAQLDSLSNDLNNLVFGCGDENLLHLKEIQAAKLSSDLVVLSACNSGIGKHAEGDGPMSLSKSFFYAGVKSTLMSLWPVPDQQTAVIIKSFYEYLVQGLNKSEALQQAKVDFLANATTLERHPAFWSGFVLYGDDSAIPIKRGMTSFQFVILGLGVLLLIGIVVFLRMK